MTTMPIRDVSLFVKVMGQGYPLALMHGGPGLDYTTLWALKPCADQFTLVFYDHRCNGRSSGDPVSGLTFENLAADADALRQALGFEKWAVLGHSFGGMVALEYALRYPQNLSHLVLLDTGADASWAQENMLQVLRQQGYSATTVAAADRFDHGRMKPIQVLPTLLKFMDAYYYQPPSISSVARAILWEPRLRMRSKTLIFAFRQFLPGWTVMDRLGAITTPTLILAGAYDFIFPPEDQAELAARIPNSQLKIIDCAGHNLHMEKPEEVIQAIRDFVGASVPVAA